MGRQLGVPSGRGVTAEMDLVESNICTARGKAFNAKVIYGDTDSVMLTLGGASMKEAFSVGKEAADLVSAAFGAPVKMEFEKVRRALFV
eukprot:Skav224432  [mRNA]  locus=scaffold3233:42500:45183:+ [translate_table: standard]